MYASVRCSTRTGASPLDPVPSVWRSALLHWKPVKSKLLSVGLAAASIVVAVVLAEGVARLALDPADFLNTVPVPDPVLGHRIKPRVNGHDALGFRNREVPARVETVVIGDSMTYGFGVPRDSAWPQQLGVLRQATVYNMGLGGYGPLQYLHLARAPAKSLRPRQLIVGFYFGNDLMEAYNLAHAVVGWHDWRETRAASAEEMPADPTIRAEPQRRFGALRHWLSQNSMLYALVRTTLLQPLASREQRGMARQLSPDQRMSWSDPAAPGVGTVFTAAGRLKVQDLSLPTVREGMRISQRALAALKDEADQQHAALLVVLIPTRERVYCRYLRNTGAELPPSHLKLCEAEEAAKSELVRTLVAKGIRHVDVTPALEAEVERHAQIYPPTSDGHPTPLGHRVIANVVHAAADKRS
jgi:lysophospholipase L1-like esterase